MNFVTYDYESLKERDMAHLAYSIMKMRLTTALNPRTIILFKNRNNDIATVRNFVAQPQNKLLSILRFVSCNPWP